MTWWRPRYCNLWRPRYCNCLIWAGWMQHSRGGWVCWRKSHNGWWPHAIWTLDQRQFYEYVPIGFSGRLKWWQILWIIVFRGEVRIITMDVL